MTPTPTANSPLPDHVVALFLKVKASILVHPERYDQYSMKTVEPSCGTPGCIVGWALHHLGVLSGTRWSIRSWKHFTGAGDDQIMRICNPGWWPSEMRSALNTCAYRSLEAAEVAAKRIDIWIESGGTV